MTRPINGHKKFVGCPPEVSPISSPPGALPGRQPPEFSAPLRHYLRLHKHLRLRHYMRLHEEAQTIRQGAATRPPADGGG